MFKEAIKSEEPGLILWDTIKLDSFKQEVGFLDEDINSMLDKFSGNTRLSRVVLELEVTDAIYKFMGGTKRTKVAERTAFLFALYRTNALFFDEFLNSMQNAISVNAALNYADEYDIPIPKSLFNAFSRSVNNDALFERVVRRHESVKIDTEVNFIDSAKFTAKFIQDMSTYYKGEHTLKNVLKDIL